MRAVWSPRVFLTYVVRPRPHPLPLSQKEGETPRATAYFLAVSKTNRYGSDDCPRESLKLRKLGELSQTT